MTMRGKRPVRERPLLRVVAFLLAVVVFSPAEKAGALKRQRPLSCAGGHYVLDTPVDGLAALEGEGLDLGWYSGIDNLCPLVHPKRIRALRRSSTRIRVHWDECPGLEGPVRLVVRLTENCNQLVGKVRSKAGRQKISGARLACDTPPPESQAPSPLLSGSLAGLTARPRPTWFDDAKFGIMIHWGIFSVPAWADTTLDPADWLGSEEFQQPPYAPEWFANIPYTEWYWNSLHIDGTPTQQHHLAEYGPDFAYEDFRPSFETASAAWSAEAWAQLFEDSGARYVVMVTKHHDGFALWNTDVPHPTRENWNLPRDVVGELTTAVRRRCMRMGLYYSGGLDWSVRFGPIQSSIEMALLAPQSIEYSQYADAQWAELIDRYRPAVMWNDLGYPAFAQENELLANFYNKVPDGVANDRLTLIPGGAHHDFSTPEFSVVTDISEEKFETVRGMGRGFGYNQTELESDLATSEELIHLLADVVSKNGNLLLNVGPRADGTIPAEQASRLEDIGAWLAVHGEAIFDTVPWSRSEGVAGAGLPVRFTENPGTSTLYATVLGDIAAGSLRIEDIGFDPVDVRLLGQPGPLAWTTDGADVLVTVPAGVPTRAAHGIALVRPTP